MVRHVCHPLNEKHECCLVELYHMDISLVQLIFSKVTAFYFKPTASGNQYIQCNIAVNVQRSRF